jgi:hypothetical protein
MSSPLDEAGILQTHKYGFTVNHMKTTVELPDELMVDLKKTAAEQKRTMRSLIIEGIHLVLKQGARPRMRKPKIRWITVDGGLPDGLDISSREKMYRWFEENE